MPSCAFDAARRAVQFGGRWPSPMDGQALMEVSRRAAAVRLRGGAYAAVEASDHVRSFLARLDAGAGLAGEGVH